MLRIQVETIIDRPAREVFAAISEPEMLKKWVAGIVESRKTSEGPTDVGTRFHQAARFLGRRIESDSVVTEYEPDSKLSFKAESGPFPFEFHYTLEQVRAGIRLVQVVEGEPGGFFKLAQPIFLAAAKRQFQTDLDNLKDLMEAGALDAEMMASA